MPKSTKPTKPVKKRAPKKKPAGEAKVVQAPKVVKTVKVPPAATTAPEVMLDEPVTGLAAETTTEISEVAEVPPVAVELVAQEVVPKPVEPQSAETAVAQTELTAGSNRRVSAKYLILVGVLLLLVAASLRWFTHAHPDNGALTAQNKSLIAEVDQRVVVPKGETPTITTVVDKDKVSQAFLANAMNGDKVLLYFQAGKAIVYRPSTHQVVNIGPLQQPPVKVFLRSGTPSGQIPAAVRAALNMPAEYTIVSQDVSPKPGYTKTLIVDLSGNRPDIAARVAKTVGGQVSSLPNGETSPDADILIIVGSATK